MRALSQFEIMSLSNQIIDFLFEMDIPTREISLAEETGEIYIFLRKKIGGRWFAIYIDKQPPKGYDEPSEDWMIDVYHLSNEPIITGEDGFEFGDQPGIQLPDGKVYPTFP